MGCPYEPNRQPVTVEILVVLALSIAGACMGSFIGTWSLRQTHGEQALVGRSHCDSCRHSLSFAEIAPIASYLMLRGLCGYCRAPLDRLQLVAEIAGALVLASAWLVHQDDPSFLIGFSLRAGLGLTLLMIAIRGFRRMSIPTGFNLLIFAFSAALAARVGALRGGIACAAVALLLLAGLRRAFTRITRREGLALSDVWLIGALAVWLRIDTALAIALAGGLGLAAARVDHGAHRRVFGPWMACAAWIVGLGSAIRL